MRTNLHGFDPHPTFQTRTALRKLCPSPLALSAAPTEVNDFGTSTRVILVYLFLFFPQLTRCEERREKKEKAAAARAGAACVRFPRLYSVNKTRKEHRCAVVPYKSKGCCFGKTGKAVGKKFPTPV